MRTNLKTAKMSIAVLLSMSSAALADPCVTLTFPWGFAAKVCGGNGSYYIEGQWAGVSLQKVQFQPYYIAENGRQYDDESFTEFSLPGMAGLGVKVQVLDDDRNDNSILSKEGDVIYSWMYWDAQAHAPNCIVPVTGNLGSSCWVNKNGSADWKRAGRL